MNIRLPLFSTEIGALGVRGWALNHAHVMAWQMGSECSNCMAS